MHYLEFRLQVHLPTGGFSVSNLPSKCGDSPITRASLGSLHRRGCLYHFHVLAITDSETSGGILPASTPSPRKGGGPGMPPGDDEIQS